MEIDQALAAVRVTDLMVFPAGPFGMHLVAAALVPEPAIAAQRVPAIAAQRVPAIAAQRVPAIAAQRVPRVPAIAAQRVPAIAASGGAPKRRPDRPAAPSAGSDRQSAGVIAYFRSLPPPNPAPQATM